MNDLAIKSTKDLAFYAKNLAKSNYFDVKSTAEALGKIQMGYELGLGPATSMSNVYIVDGKPTLSSNVLAGKVKESDKYRYEVEKSTREGCIINWFERVDGNWKNIGQSSFTKKDAKQAGLLNKNNWKNYSTDMYFARALTRGVRQHAPDVAIAGAYTPEELNNGEPVEDQEEIISDDEYEVDFEVVDEDDDSPEDRQSDEPVQETDQPADETNDEPTEKMRKAFHAVGSKLYDEKPYKPDWDEKRSMLVDQITSGRTESSKDLTNDEMSKLLTKMKDKLDELDGYESNYWANYNSARSLAKEFDDISGKQKHDEIRVQLAKELGHEDRLKDNQDDEQVDDTEDEDMSNVDPEDIEF